MKNIFLNITIIIFLCLCFSNKSLAYNPFSYPDSLKYPINDSSNSPLYLNNPSNITTSVEYDALNNEYIITKKIGDIVIDKKVLGFNYYQKYDLDNMINSYWKNKGSSSIGSNQSESNLNSLIPQLRVNSELFETIFGGQNIDIRPSGSLELKFALVNNKNDNLSLNENQRSVTRFDFDEDIQLNVLAQIGTAISFNLN